MALEEGQAKEIEQSLSGVRKAAILLVALKPDLAATVISGMDLRTIEVVTKEIARIQTVPSEQKEYVLDEFFQMNMARQYLEQGGVIYARQILEDANKRKEELEKQIRETYELPPMDLIG